MKQEYLDTVRLLIDIAPTVFRSEHFAMKGGTALNLFVQDMPRLSVDIDVVFTDHLPGRDEALSMIDRALKQARRSLEQAGFAVTAPQASGGEEIKLLVRDEKAEVKIEVNHVFRGTLLPTVVTPLSEAAQELFTSGLSVPLLDGAELYGSKLVAAMDRQHPRDIFDVMKMREKFGLPSRFVDCFVAYLAGHGRPVHEVLFGNEAPLEQAYENQFKGMTAEAVSLEALLDTRKALKTDLPRSLTQEHKQFLLSLVQLEPAWELMPFAHLKDLPALKWKFLNLEKLKAAKPAVFRKQYDLLAERLAG